MIPHITDEIKGRFYRETPSSKQKALIAIIEVGGTVGDIESQPFLEAIRQFQQDVGRENTCLIHVTLITYLKASGEMKTKPTQASVKAMQGMGLQPDILVCRSEYPMDSSLRNKIGRFCNVPASRVLQNLDCEILYEVPLEMEKEHLAQATCECLCLPCPEPDLADWNAMIDAWKHPLHKVTVALVGKYVSLHDAYLSVAEALRHGGVANRTAVQMRWVDSEQLNDENAAQYLEGVNGILVPGGFGSRGIAGKISAIRYARERSIPFLGLCLGMQLAIVEFARHVIGYHDAHSTELEPATTHPVIHLMPGQNGVENLGGTLRLGNYPCTLLPDSLAYRIYGCRDTIQERHRHRYEVNNSFRQILIQAGMRLSGLSPDGTIVEMCELPEHPWFVGTQGHPEFKSRPNKPAPLFQGFVAASLSHAQSEKLLFSEKR